jgi:hypothetical protein
MLEEIFKGGNADGDLGGGISGVAKLWGIFGDNVAAFRDCSGDVRR